MPKDDPQFEGYITLKEAARISGYSADYIGQLIRKGKIKGRQVYTNIAWVTTEEDLRAYLSGKNSPSPDVPTREESPSPENFQNSRDQWLVPRFFPVLRIVLWVLLVLAFVSALFVLFVLVNSFDHIVSRGEPLAAEMRVVHPMYDHE
jgi:hypothetical protein